MTKLTCQSLTVINDDLSVSYEKEKSEAIIIKLGLQIRAKVYCIQVAYNMGGMTLALSRNSHDNVGYCNNCYDREQTLVAVTMAF